MTAYNAERIVKNASDRARSSYNSIPGNVTCHMFRHGRAMQLYRKGMSLSMIGQLLGHSNPETTLIYAYADTEVKRTAIMKAAEGFSDLPQPVIKPHAYDEAAVLTAMGLKN